VIMFITPGEIELPGVVREILEVEIIVTSFFISNILNYPNAKTVLNRLNRYNAVHFACYGTSN